MLSGYPLTLSEGNLEKTAGTFSESDSFSLIHSRVKQAEARAGRPDGSTQIIAVSKTKSAELVVGAWQRGQVDFGENYVQESLKKIEKITHQVPREKIHWHFIGNLQTNKSAYVVGKFETIQSVDRSVLVKSLNTRAQQQGVVQKILLQIKLGDEPTKGGANPSEVPKLLELLKQCPNLRVMGLMSLPPQDVEAEASRKYFVQLRELRDLHKSTLDPQVGELTHLSMGTSHDFEVAIEEGATMIRIGTALFGPRA